MCPKAAFLSFHCQKDVLYLPLDKMRWEACGLEADTAYNFTFSTGSYSLLGLLVFLVLFVFFNTLVLDKKKAHASV